MLVLVLCCQCAYATFCKDSPKACSPQKKLSGSAFPQKIFVYTSYSTCKRTAVVLVVQYVSTVRTFRTNRKYHYTAKRIFLGLDKRPSGWLSIYCFVPPASPRRYSHLSRKRRMRMYDSDVLENSSKRSRENVTQPGEHRLPDILTSPAGCSR